MLDCSLLTLLMGFHPCQPSISTLGIYPRLPTCAAATRRVAPPDLKHGYSNLHRSCPSTCSLSDTKVYFIPAGSSTLDHSHTRKLAATRDLCQRGHATTVSVHTGPFPEL